MNGLLVGGGGVTLPIRFLGAGLPYDSVFPSDCPSELTRENNAFSSKTNKEIFAKFYMQLYWPIPHTIRLMTFDLRGQI